MKPFFLILLCLLLSGCGRDAPETEPTLPTIAVTVPETLPPSAVAGEEVYYDGGLEVYPLTLRKVRAVRAMGEDLLVFSGHGSTTLTLLTGDDLTVAAEVTLEQELDARDPSLQIGADTLSFYDAQRQQTVVLNPQLKEVRTHVLTEQHTGSPILSSSQTTVYYITGHAIRAWDLNTGIHRTLTELHYDEQSLTGLHLSDTVLQCRIRDGAQVQTLFLSTQSGQILSRQEGDVSLVTEGTRFYASLPVDFLTLPVFGDTSGKPKVLYHEDTAAELYYLPRQQALVTVSIPANDRTILHCYDLDAGTHWAELTLDTLQTVKSVVSSSDGTLWILAHDPAGDRDVLCRWEMTAQVFAPADPSASIQLYSGGAADADVLARCQALAAQIGETYGITILTGADALAVQPWDYAFEAETLPQVLLRELELLDQRLRACPQTVLEQTAAHFTSLHLCLVRSITGTAASGSLNTATGVQFLDSTDAYVAIAVGQYSRQALYHELFHLMETHIFTESIALDQWNELNPQGFAYSFGTDAPGGWEAYLADEDRAFVDSYSMTYPKEDRARVFENAMLPGNADLFTSETMRAKLTALCQGIREAYRLKKSEETYLWEQYLETPLAYVP